MVRYTIPDHRVRYTIPYHMVYIYQWSLGDRGGSLGDRNMPRGRNTITKDPQFFVWRGFRRMYDRTHIRARAHAAAGESSRAGLLNPWSQGHQFSIPVHTCGTCHSLRLTEDRKP